MKKGFLVLACLVLSGCAQHPLPQDMTAMKVLTYFPACQYEVLGKVKATSGLSQRDYDDKKALTQRYRSKNLYGTQQEALNKIKQKAYRLGADAIAITHFSAIEGTITAGNGQISDLKKFSIGAEAIKTCQESVFVSNENKKRTKYLADGSLNRLARYTNTVKLDLSHKSKPKNQPVEKQRVISNNVSLSGGIYDVTLGDSYERVVNHFGEPTAIENITPSIQALFYGKKNIFYFSEKLLVGFEYGKWILPLVYFNELPYLDKFDTIDLRINNEIALNELRTNVTSKIAKKERKSSKEMLVYQQGQVVTELGFSTNMDDASIQLLKSISIYSTQLMQNNIRNAIEKSKQSNNMVIKLSRGIQMSGTDSINDIKARFGAPWVVMFKAKNKQQWIYKNNLIISFLNGQVVKAELNENTASNQVRDCQNCLYIGQSIEAIGAQAQLTSSEADNKWFAITNDTRYKLTIDKQSSPEIIVRIEIDYL